MEGLAHGEALSPAEVPVPGGGAQIVPLRHRQEVLGPVGFHALDLGGPDAHGDDLVHGELCPAGDVGAKSHPDALLQHLPHRGDAAAQVDVGPGAVGHHHPGPADGGALPGVGVDAVGHHRVVLPQAVFVIGLPILGAVRVQLLHPGDLPPVFRQMGLDIQPPVPGDAAQGGHQLIGTAGGEAGGDDGPDVLKMAAVQPAQGLGDGLLRGLLENAGQGVAVHIHLAHIARDPGPLQLLHKDPGGLGVQGGEHAHPGGAVGDQVGGQAAIGPAGKVRVCEPGLGAEGVGIQPVQQGQVHAHAQHGILGRVEVHIHKGLHDEPVAVVRYGGGGQGLGQRVIDPLHHAVLQHQIAVLPDVQLPQPGSLDDVAA